jgi:uncharacterized repeat protein (TIGR01451 family)
VRSNVKSNFGHDQLRGDFADATISGVLIVMRKMGNAVLLAGVSASAFVASPAWANPAASANNANYSQITAGNIAQTVPDGVCTVAVTVRGGGGASSGTTAVLGGVGGAGAVINARFNVLAGQAVTGAVASGGGVGNASLTAANNGTGTANGGNGGSVGGGSTTLHRGGGGGGSSAIIVGGIKMVEAGGGGGGGAAHQAPTLGAGGIAGFSLTAPGVAVGGNGNVGNNTTNNGGQGGQSSAGGLGGAFTPTTTNGNNGFAGGGIGTGTGGNGAADFGTDTGGGGGGGYTGGGGGSSTVSDTATAAGGGGGSSFVRATSPTVSAASPSAVSGVAGPATAPGAFAGAAGLATIDWIPCRYVLNLSKTASLSTVNAGAKTVWTVAVRNDGPDPMTKGDVVTLTDTLPTGPIGAPAPQFKILSIATSGGTNADMASGAVTCTGLSAGSAMTASTVCSRPYSAPSAPGTPSGGTRGLNSGETLTITYEQVFANTAAAASITNTATVNDRSTLIGTTDITGTNVVRTSAATVNVVPYNLRVSKTASSSLINSGGNITWTINVTNDGPGNMFGPDDTAANNLSVADVAPTANAAAPTGFTASGPAGACTYTLGVINCPGNLNSGQTQTFSFQQTVSSLALSGTQVVNTAVVTDYVIGDTDDSAVATVTVSPSANLSIVKSNGVSSVISGSTITYSLLVTNNGPDSTTGPVVTDVPGAGITCPGSNAVTITGNGIPAGSFTVANLTGAGITLGTLANGQSATLSYACQVN